MGFTIFFTTVYAAQLSLAGSLSENAALQTSRMVRESIGNSTILLSWFFHNSHQHFLSNIPVFFLTGWWVENRVDRTRFIYGVAALGMGANFISAFFGLFVVGASGITTGLIVMAALGSFERLNDSSAGLIRSIVLFTALTTYSLYTVGLVAPLPSGTAVETHAIGGGIGFVWYILEKGKYDFDYRLSIY